MTKQIPRLETKKLWVNMLVNKTISEVLFDNIGFAGFRLSDGIVIKYDIKRGLYVELDKVTGEPVRYN